MPKSIGIITLQGNNYGATLQAVALNYWLNQNGYHAENIDYNDPKRVSRGLSSRQMMVNAIWTRIRNLLGGNQKDLKFEQFRKKYLIISNIKWRSPDSILQNPPLYDVYISGSDQIWNPDVINGDYNYLLKFVPEGCKRISYASSFGKGAIKETQVFDYANFLSKYDHLSVREKTGEIIIQRMIGREAQVVLDPTLLLSGEEWKELIVQKPEKKPFILCYYMPGDQEICKTIKSVSMKLAKQTGLHIINLGLKEYNVLIPWKDSRITAGPDDFVRLFSQAEYVITNSFHGTAFAVNFGKKLYVPVKGKAHDKESRQTRMIDFLQLIDYEDALHSINDNIDDIIEIRGMRPHSTALLSQLREQSMRYLRNSIEY